MKPELKSLIRTTVQQARKLLFQETREQLEGIYGLRADGAFENIDNLPQIQKDAERQKILLELIHFINAEEKAGLARKEAVDKLIQETAFTHLNRLTAFKMMEARKLLRGTVNKGHDSNGFKYYLAEHPDVLAQYKSGKTDEAYQDFLLWQCRQIAEKDHLEMLFRTDNLPSRLFPRPLVLKQLLEWLNAANLQEVWPQDETIGWVYQYFIEEDKDRVFDKIYQQKQKMGLREIPLATQIFTPRWIVEYLVHNTLGRLWLRMHPDSRLAEKMRYFVPNPYNDKAPIPLKPVREITLLDPACGTMHFGLVAFDLFYEMYCEEMAQVGRDGWPAEAPVKNEAEIPAAILEHNLYGIDIDLRAIQLSALTLYLKAKSLNHDLHIHKLNLTYTDIPGISEADQQTFINSLPLEQPITKELLAQIIPELNKAYYLGSLLKIEETVQHFIDEKRSEIKKLPPLLQQLETGTRPEFWEQMREDLLQGLRQVVEKQTNGQRLIAGEAIQGLGLVDALVKKYDIVVTNPPYAGRKNIVSEVFDTLKKDYLLNSNDLYSIFIQRNAQLLNQNGFLAMITQQSFMFTSSFQELREFLISDFAFQSLQQFGSKAFEGLGGDKISTCTFVLNKNPNPKISKGIYFKLTEERFDEKRIAFEKALHDWQTHGEQATDRHLFVVKQEDFKAIPGWPLVYWISHQIRNLFKNKKFISEYVKPSKGNISGDNIRFLRFIWEVSKKKIHLNCISHDIAKNSILKWYPYMKGGEFNKWYGNQCFVINWQNDGKEIKEFSKFGSRNPGYYFKTGLSYTKLTTSGLNVRFMPIGFICDDTGGPIYEKVKNAYWEICAILNSKFGTYLAKIINPTIIVQSGDLEKFPLPIIETEKLRKNIDTYSKYCIFNKMFIEMLTIFSFEFKIPYKSIVELIHKEQNLALLESDISTIVYQLYEISDEGIHQIETEFGALPTRMPQLDLAIPNPSATIKTATALIRTYYLEKHIPEEALKRTEETPDAEDGDETPTKSRRQSRYLNFEEVCLASGYHPDTVYEIITQNQWERPEERFDLALNWLEYALGVLMGRFKPGHKGELGCAIIHKNDFITGSLTISDEAFAEITQFFQTNYTDEQGKHFFSPQQEQQLGQKADPDGIMVLDQGHPDDLPAKIEEVLILMLGEKTAQEILATLIGENAPNKERFRKFMERDFFAKHHVKMYRKRPIYWLLQTANKNYGFYVFHERFDGDTLFKLQRNYIDPKLNLIDQQIRELTHRMAQAGGAEQRQMSREQERLHELYQEIKAFSAGITTILDRRDETGATVGYNPDINDGVILNMAAIHELIPWKEPVSFWKEIEAGRYDWAHLARHYWPKRVLEKCQRDKSLAIAHGVEDIFQKQG